MVRGCKFCFAERYIEEPYALDIWFPNREGIEGAEAMLSGGTTETLGPGLTIKRRAVHEERITASPALHSSTEPTRTSTRLPNERAWVVLGRIQAGAIPTCVATGSRANLRREDHRRLR
jgi:hypothetical protein